MSDAERQTERLNRAIDRLTSHQLAPIFDEPELDDLVELAGRLHGELPDSLPDPAFRESLREQILDPRPRPVPTMQHIDSRRSPLVAATGAIAAMLVVAVAVGVVSTGVFGGSDSPDDERLEFQMVGSPTLVNAAAEATVTASTVATRPARESVVPTVTSEPTRVLAASVPPIDADHLELGAMSTAEVARPDAASDITYSMSPGGMEDTPSSAPVYRFSVPEIDGMNLLTRVASSLKLDSEISVRTARGKAVFSLTSESGTSFVWMPASGAFACTLSGEASVQGDQDEMVESTYRWLTASGFPVRDPSTSAAVVKAEGSGLRVDYPVETAPDVALGHPLTVSVLIDEHGAIKTVSGYWLQLEETQHIGLMSPDAAWSAIAAGKGVWMSHAALQSPGHFEVKRLSVSYVLTVDDRQQLVLQPVYRASGTFRDSAGNVTDGVSVVLQAMTQPEQIATPQPGT